MAITNKVSLTLEQLDATSATVTRRVFSVSDILPTVGEFRSGNLIDTSATTINLPIVQPRQILVRNTHASAKITVIWTPYGGASVTVTKLGPNAAIMLWDPTAAATTIGISALSLTSDTSNTTFEVFLGG